MGSFGKNLALYSPMGACPRIVLDALAHRRQIEIDVHSSDSRYSVGTSRHVKNVEGFTHTSRQIARRVTSQIGLTQKWHFTTLTFDGTVPVLVLMFTHPADDLAPLSNYTMPQCLYLTIALEVGSMRPLVQIMYPVHSQCPCQS